MPRPLSRYLQDDGTLVVCGFCYTPLSRETEAARIAALHGDATVRCDACGCEIHEACVYSPPEWRGLALAPCPRCGATGVADARACAHCRKLTRVDEEFLDEDGQYTTCCLCETRAPPAVETARIAALGTDAMPPCPGCGFELWDVYGRVPGEWHALERAACPLCNGESFAQTRVCAACRRWKQPEDDEQRAHNERVTTSAR